MPLFLSLIACGRTTPADQVPATRVNATQGDSAAAPHPSGKPQLSLGGQPLASPVAVLDPTGVLELSGSLDGERRAWRIGFRALEFPAPGDFTVAPRASESTLAARWSNADGFQKPSGGSVAVRAFGPDRVAGVMSLSTTGGDQEVAFDLDPELRPVHPATVENRRDVSFPPASDVPQSEDLVFCAIGNSGTGLPGARAVARQVAELAPTGPLDFVLLLGDVFAPKGVESMSDPQWQSKFEQLFDVRSMNVPFYPVPGDAEHRGNLQAYLDYGHRSPRWSCPKLGYQFEVQSHGKTLAFFALDSIAARKPISKPEARLALRGVSTFLRDSKADFKIVFAHDPVWSNGFFHGSRVQKSLQKALEYYFDHYGCDVYIAAGDHSLELLESDNHGLQIVSGGGGGPEMATAVTWRNDTMFAHTGGGFAWFRFDGNKLEISVRDADGNVVFVHHLRK